MLSAAQLALSLFSLISGYELELTGGCFSRPPRLQKKTHIFPSNALVSVRAGTKVGAALLVKRSHASSVSTSAKEGGRNFCAVYKHSDG